MASSLCRRIYRSFLYTNPINNHHQKLLVSAHNFSSSDSTSGSDSTTQPEPDPDPLPQFSHSNPNQREFVDRPLENGLDIGVYRVFLLLLGDISWESTSKCYREEIKKWEETMLSLGTGGMRNNRRPLHNEEPRDYANRSMVQWHRVSIYADRLGALVAKMLFLVQLYIWRGIWRLKIFNDPITGLIRRVREAAIRGDGRVVFFGNGDDGQEPQQAELKGVGYY